MLAEISLSDKVSDPVRLRGWDMERWGLDTLKPLLEEEGQNVLFIKKIATKHEMGLSLGVEGNQGKCWEEFFQWFEVLQ